MNKGDRALILAFKLYKMIKKNVPCHIYIYHENGGYIMSKYDVILDVYENRCISKAAAKHNYTQSAVSQAIHNYEKEIGLTLFKRSKNGMEALPGTEPIFAELMNIRTSSERISQIVANINSLDRGFIRIGTVQSIAYHWLPGILKSFSAEYPNITFQLYVDGFQKLTEKLRKKELDCIFVSQYVAKDFQSLPVGTDELVLVTATDHPLANKLTVSFADIDEQDFVLSADDFDYETGKLFRIHQITPNIRFRINEDYTAVKMVEQGFGITVLPRLLLHNIPFNVCVRSFTEHFRRNLVAAYLETPEPTPALNKFLTFVSKWTEECKLI